MLETSSGPSLASPQAPTLADGVDVRLLDDMALPAEAREYFLNRWLGEVRWFAAATRRSRRLHYGLSAMSLTSSSLTATFAGLSVGSPGEATHWVLAALGLSSALSAGFLALFQQWSSWKRRSVTLERLKSEGRQFLLLAGAYSTYGTHQEAFNALAQKIENIVAQHKTESFSKEPELPLAVRSGHHGWPNGRNVT